jgi:hypothetical protein
MNPMINSSRLLAAALCAAILAGCNAVEDVDDEPTGPLPVGTVVLGGTIKNLGTRRPLVLQNNGADVCLVPVTPTNPGGPKMVSECVFLGTADQEASQFSFGAVNVGTPYNVTIKRQPYGKICTVQNPTGTVQPDTPEIQINCADDPAVARYTVTVNIAPAAAAKPGLQVVLTTENGTCPVDVNGRSVITFTPAECPDSGPAGYHRNAPFLFNSGVTFNTATPPVITGAIRTPVFGWAVTASVPGPSALSNRTACFVTNNSAAAAALSPPIVGLVPNTGGNIDVNGNTPATAVPQRSVPAGIINVVQCGFDVTVQADYSRGPTESAPDPTNVGGDGITVAMRSQPYGIDVASAKITTYGTTPTKFMVPDANGDPTTTVYSAQSDPNAFYELVITKAPAGLACMPGASVAANSLRPTANLVGNLTDGGAVLLRQPASSFVQNAWLIDRVIRCRAIAANPTPQRGVYWQYTKTTTTRVAPLAASVVTATVYNRFVLALFEDGQYIFGNHNGNGNSTEGVEQGFYAHNGSAAAVGTLAPASMHFVAMTDITGASGLNNSGAARTITNVVKSTAGSLKTITADASSTDGLLLPALPATSALTVKMGAAAAVPVAPGTYSASPPSSFTTARNNLMIAINAAAGTTIAAASGNEIRITAPSGTAVLFAGSAVGTLGLPTAAIAGGASATTTNVLNTLATKVNVQWILQEIGPDTRVTTTNALDGSWVTWDWQRTPAPVEDRRRVFVYQHGAYNMIHLGLNGIPNLQATCLAGNFALAGTWTRHGSGQGCQMRFLTDTVTNGGPVVQTTTPAFLNNQGNPQDGLASADNPSPVITVTAPLTNLNLLRDIPGRWPQSQNPAFTDGRPYSLVEYEVRLAGTQPTDPVCPTLDKLTVWDTINGIRKDTLNPPVPRIVLCRVKAN